MGLGRFLRDGGWVIFGQLVSALGALAAIRIVTELLSPDAFGRLTLLVGVSALVHNLTAVPTMQSVIRFFADCSNQGDIAALRRVSGTLIARSVMFGAFGLVLLWAMIGSKWGDAPYTGALVASALIIDAARNFEFGLFNAARRQRAAALIVVADAWCRPILAVISVSFFGASAQSVLVGYIVASALVVATMRATMSLEGRAVQSSELIPPKADGKMERLALAIRRYSMPLIPVAIFGWFNGMGDRYIIGAMIGLEQAGLYAAAYGLVSRPFLMVASTVELIFRPILHNAIAADNRKRIKQVERLWLAAVGVCSAIGVIGFYEFSDVIVRIMFAESYGQARYIMPWIAAGSALFNIATVLTRFCYAFNDTWNAFLVIGMGTAITILVLVPLVFYYGLIGAAVANPIYFGAQILLALFFSKRSEKHFHLTKVVQAVQT
ncbi:lipopolysaccharide biosynthesis protein [Mesorhizobium sp. M1163]|uniref:lipopolysaccharide biosynthesis protein n=1 Tax=Mesorhizobium sp. M1163 TaxID=2957065 RepID=UPI0033364062